MHYELILTGKFKKSLKLAKKRGLNLKLLDTVITMLQNNIPLEEKYHDHELKGKYQGFRERIQKLKGSDPIKKILRSSLIIKNEIGLKE